MMNNKAIRKAIKRCGDIHVKVLEDSLDFGPRNINDPESGNSISIEGYNMEQNQHLLLYMDLVETALKNYYNCLKDLFFFETIFSPEYLPNFPEPDQMSDYLTIFYQSWLIKINTIFDCTMQSLNAVFELGIKLQNVRKQTIVSNENIIGQSDVLSRLNNLYKILSDEVVFNRRRETPKSFSNIRNKIVHYNDFKNEQIDDLSADMFLNFFILDNHTFDLHSSVQATSAKLKDEISQFNFKVLQEVYPIFEYLGQEYERRFKKKLVKRFV